MKPLIETVGAWGKTYVPFIPAPGRMEHDHFDSIHAVRQWLDDASPTGGAVPNSNPNGYGARLDRRASTAGGRPHSWDLSAGWDGAKAMAFTGWVAGGIKLRTLSDQLLDLSPETSEQAACHEMSLTTGETGAFVDVASYLSGDETPWILPTWEATKPAVHIAIANSISAGVDGNDMVARGMVIAAAIRRLEMMGFAVSLTVVFLSWGQSAPSRNGHVHVHSIRVKNTDQLLDDDTLAFWTSHPASARRIDFRFMESSAVMANSQNGAYGYPGDFTSSDFHFTSNAAHLDTAKTQGWHGNPAAAARGMQSIIEKTLGAMGGR